MNEKIEGIPDGWRMVRFGSAKTGDDYLRRTDGYIVKWTLRNNSEHLYAIVEKIEKPTQYRPFASGEEFKPHRDRWVRCKAQGSHFKIIEFYRNELFIGRGLTRFSWSEAFNAIVFDDDGSPFGVEVAE